LRSFMICYAHQILDWSKQGNWDGQLLWLALCTFMFHEVWRVSWLSEKVLVAVQELCSVELVTWNLYENGRNIFFRCVSAGNWGSCMHEYEVFWMLWWYVIWWTGTSNSEQPNAHIYPEGSCIRFAWNFWYISIYQHILSKNT
jgi:hypothetical protein